MRPADIKSNLEALQRRVDQACLKAGRSSEEVTMIVVTKTIDSLTIETAYDLGICNFGENRVQEAEDKINALNARHIRPTWHMIGHLQSNKVKTALELFDVIQSVDSIELAEALNRRAQRKIPVFLQVNVAGELTKRGYSINEIGLALEAVSHLPNLEIRGLMTIAPLVDNTELVRPVFRKMRELKECFGVKHLSMGMTEDFEVAIEEGATMIRIGRGIFGERVISKN